MLKDAGFHLQSAARRGTGRHGLPDHYELRDYQFVFAVVRRPKAWYESIWRYQVDHKWKHWEPTSWHPWRVLEPYASDDFNAWIRAVLLHEPAYLTRMAEQVVGPEGWPRVLRVLRYENLLAELSRLLQDLGVDKDKAEVACTKAPLNESTTPAPAWDKTLLEEVIIRETPLLRRWYGIRIPPPKRFQRELPRTRATDAAKSDGS